MPNEIIQVRIKEIADVPYELRADVFISPALLGADVGWCFIPNWVAFTSSRFRWRIPLNDMSSSSHATLCLTNRARAHTHRHARAHTRIHTRARERERFMLLSGAVGKLKLPYFVVILQAQQYTDLYDILSTSYNHEPLNVIHVCNTSAFSLCLFETAKYYKRAHVHVLSFYCVACLSYKKNTRTPHTVLVNNLG